MALFRELTALTFCLGFQKLSVSCTFSKVTVLLATGVTTGSLTVTRATASSSSSPDTTVPFTSKVVPTLSSAYRAGSTSSQVTGTREALNSSAKLKPVGPYRSGVGSSKAMPLATTVLGRMGARPASVAVTYSSMLSMPSTFTSKVAVRVTVWPSCCRDTVTFRVP